MPSQPFDQIRISLKATMECELDPREKMVIILRLLQNGMSDEALAEFISDDRHMVKPDTIGRWRRSTDHRNINTKSLQRIIDAYARRGMMLGGELSRELHSLVHVIDGELRGRYVRRLRVALDDADEFQRDGCIAYDRCSYTFVKPTRRRDLSVHVRLSDEDAGILGTHRWLVGAKRAELYRGWWLRNSKTFMTVQREDKASARFADLAISIVLPLDREGHDFVASGRNDAVSLPAERIVSSGPPYAVLIDTWIKDPVLLREQRRSPELQLKQDSICVLGLLKHVSNLWLKGTDVRLLVEPATPGMRGLCQELGFVPTTDHGKCLSLVVTAAPMYARGARDLQLAIQRLRD